MVQLIRERIWTIFLELWRVSKLKQPLLWPWREVNLNFQSQKTRFKQLSINLKPKLSSMPRQICNITKNFRFFDFLLKINYFHTKFVVWMFCRAGFFKIWRNESSFVNPLCKMTHRELTRFFQKPSLSFCRVREFMSFFGQLGFPKTESLIFWKWLKNGKPIRFCLNFTDSV